MRYWVLLGMFIGVLPVAAVADERTTPLAPQEVTITLTEYKYDPARIEVQSGKPVALHLVNSGKVLHEFVSDVLSDVTVDVETQGAVALVRGVEELEVLPGATVILRFTPKKAGEFSFRCDAETPVSHREGGMKGVLIVR